MLVPTDLATTNGDQGTIQVILFRTDFTDDESMADFLLLVRWNISVLDQEEGIGTIDTFCAGLGAGPDALAESAKFVSVQLVVGVYIVWSGLCVQRTDHILPRY